MKEHYKSVEDMLIAVADKVQKKCDWVKAEPVTVYGNKRQWVVGATIYMEDEECEYSSTATVNAILTSLVNQLDIMFPETTHEANFHKGHCGYYHVSVRTSKRKRKTVSSLLSIREFMHATIQLHPKLA